MSEPETEVACEVHGDSHATYLCRHLTEGGVALGFFCADEDDDPRPDAWCTNCNRIQRDAGGWNESTMEAAGIRVVCAGCYDEIRTANQLMPGGASDEEPPPGLRAVLDRLFAVYPKRLGFPAVVPLENPPEDWDEPLLTFRIYTNEEPDPHIHIVTYGLSTDRPRGGLGFELAMRLPLPPAFQIPDWAMDLLVDLANRAVAAKKPVAPGQVVVLTKPVEGKFHGVVFADDASIGTVGKTRFLQVVGVLKSDLLKGPALLPFLRAADPLLRTDPAGSRS